MRIVVLAGGIGGARFLRGLKQAAPDADITVIGNTGDDIHLFGLKVCPDLDTVMYTLGGGINEEQGWGRTDETFTVKEELAAYGVGPEWFGLGDRDFATHIVRTQMLGAGYPLSAVTEALCDAMEARAYGCIPMSDDRVETHVAVETRTASARRCTSRSTGCGCAPPSRRTPSCRSARSRPSPRPGCWRPSPRPTSCSSRRPTRSSSVGTILAVPGIREAIADAGCRSSASPPSSATRRCAAWRTRCLAAVGVESTAAAVAEHYGSGLLDGWLVDTVDAGAVAGSRRPASAAGPCR